MDITISLDDTTYADDLALLTDRAAQSIPAKTVTELVTGIVTEWTSARLREVYNSVIYSVDLPTMKEALGTYTDVKDKISLIQRATSGGNMGQVNLAAEISKLKAETERIIASEDLKEAVVEEVKLP